MEIRQFITFRTIVDVGSYTNAAAKLGYTQSTITAHIQALEQQLGGPVFSYVKRELHLTDLGRELVGMVDELLGSYQRIEKLNDNRVNGELKIAAPESLTISRLGPILKTYSMKYPEVKIKLSNGTCGDNQKELLNGNVDVAFMLWPELQTDNYVYHKLHKEEIVLVTAPEKASHFDDYKGTEACFVTNEEGCSYRVMFEEHVIKQDIPRFQTMELWSLEAIKQVVASGLGFAALPLVTVEKEIENGTLKLLEYTESFKPIYSYMMVRSKNWHSPAVDKFMEIVRELSNKKIEV
ncbi:regulatory protein [Terribacillus saccharophilus]|uniref:Regulatory protein n=1 Tax=Terribacillus saccharophilus TaxID=361277 RepID=A0A075LFV4_9BACI|nr:LysR family transcriptional regulator [Terribacillus goriensis]AIF65550.1 regulatory protein [Terribacillus goriensis]